jgi:hypothetical protein
MHDLQQNKDKLSDIGKYCFIGYYGIMVILKAFGYVSYETFYQIAFVLALGLLGVKILMTRYTIREFLILYLLLAVSAVCWLRVGEKNVMLTTLSLWGIKNVDLRDVIKCTFPIRILGILFMILFSGVGILDIEKTTSMATDYSLRTVYAFGYGKVNTTFFMIFVAIVIFLYLSYERLNFWHFLISMALTYAGFKATYCRTGMIVFFGMWALIFIDKFWCKKTYYKLLCYQVPFLMVISIAAMVFYKHSSSLWFKINRIFNGRIEIASDYHKAFGVTLLPKPAQIFWQMNATTMDNFYMYFFVSCGLLFAVGYCAVAVMTQKRLYENRKTAEILFFTVFAVYAMVEQGPFNPVLNPFMLLIGNIIYRNFAVRETEFGTKKKIADPAGA